MKTTTCFPNLTIGLLTSTFLYLSGCTSISVPSDLDKAYFANAVIVQQDSTTGVLTFSTIKGWQNRQAPAGDVWDDNFIRGFLDPQTGQRAYQVYNVVYYPGIGGGEWRHYAQASYPTASKGTKLVPARSIKEKEDCSPLPYYGKCLYNEHVVFSLEESLLRTLTVAYNNQSQGIWEYALLPEIGQSYPDKLPLAEIAGLVARMDSYSNSTLSTPKVNSAWEALLLTPESEVPSPPKQTLPPK